MTKEEILAMSAGPELDDLVARQVMNLDDTSFHYDVEMGISERIKYNDFIDDHIWVSFNPSTDISAAWEVVEKLKGNGECQIYWWTDHWEAWFGKSETVKAGTAPEAIVKAALLAVMEGKDDK